MRFDLLPVLRGAANGERLFYDHCHLTPRGNALVAEALAPFVASQLRAPTLTDRPAALRGDRLAE